METLGLLSRSGTSLLDIGSSNLYFADAPGIAAFIRRHAADPGSDLDEFARRMAHGSRYDPVTGGANETFLGEVLERAGFRYESIDIAKGYRTRIVDLNHASLPEDMVGAFDSVINFGTTEHLINQANAFRVIHQATRTGGLIWHQLPYVGFLDHGYFTYTGRYFFDLAGYNRYDIVDMWLQGPLGEEEPFAAARSYRSVFPALEHRLAQIGVDERDTRISKIGVPTLAINVVYRKVHDAPFMQMSDTSTSVGEVVRSGGVAASVPRSATTALASSGAGSVMTRRMASVPTFVRHVADRLRSRISRASSPDIVSAAAVAAPAASEAECGKPDVEPAPPANASEQSLDDRIAAVRALPLGQEGQDALQALFTEIRRAGRAIPADLEERSLRLIVRERPDDDQSLLKLYYIIQQQGKEMTEDVEEPILKARIKTMVAPERLVNRLKKIYRESKRVLSDSAIRDICIPDRTYERVFYCFALPKSASRLMMQLMIGAQGKDGFQLVMPTYVQGDAGLAVTTELRFEYLRGHEGGWLHSHAGPTHPTRHVLDRLQIRHLITLRHPADHIAALYCHLRQLHPEVRKAEPPEETAAPLKRVLDETRLIQDVHQVIHPVNRSFFASDVAVEDAIDHLINDGYLVSALKWIADWATFANRSLACFVRYEDLMRDGEAVLTDAYRFLRKSEPVVPIRMPEPETSADRAIYPRGYSGKVGIHAQYFSQKNIDDYNKVVRSFLEATRTSRKFLEVYPDALI